MKDFVMEARLEAPHARHFTARKRPTFYETSMKRIFDIVLCLALAPLILPIIGICWILVRLDGGPGFYSQPRVGKAGKQFQCWKLRTMVVDAETVLKRLCDSDPKIAREWHVRQKLENDPRITRIGRFLRATSLDELPQFFNVLFGDMSFVGPRPFMVDQQALYRGAGGRSYFRMRPGITGHWQIFGRATTSFTDRVSYDDNYYHSVGFVEDIRLILKTGMIVLKRTGT